MTQSNHPAGPSWVHAPKKDQSHVKTRKENTMKRFLLTSVMVGAIVLMACPHVRSAGDGYIMLNGFDDDLYDAVAKYQQWGLMEALDLAQRLHAQRNSDVAP